MRHVEELEQQLAGTMEQLAAMRQDLQEMQKSPLKFFHLRQGLASMQKTTESAIQLDNQAIKKIEAVSAEYHEAGKHLKNVGRALMGKEAVQEAKPMGKLAKTIAVPYKADRACLLAMRGTIQKAISGLDRLEQAAQKPSILQAMREQSEKAKAEPPKEAPVKNAER